MSLFRRLKKTVRQPESPAESARDSERAVNVYIETASERLRSFHVQVQRMQAQGITLQHKIADLDDFINRYHDSAKSSLSAGDEAGARKHLEDERHERDKQNELREQLAKNEQTVRQLQAQYEKLNDRLERAKAARQDMLTRLQRAQTQIDAFATLTDIDVHNPLSDFEQLERDVLREEARAEAEYELRHETGDTLSTTIANLQREVEAEAKAKGQTDTNSVEEGETHSE